MNKEKYLGTVLVILSAITFGFMPLIANLAYDQGTSVNTLLFLRFGIGSIILWLYVLMKKISFKISKSHLVHIVLISLIGYTLSASTYFNAFRYIPSSLTTIIFFSYPVIVVMYEMIKSKTIDQKKILCLLTTMTGLILVVGVGNSKVELNWTGIILAGAAAGAYAYFCIGVGEERTQKMNSIVVSAYVMGICAVFYFFQCLFTGNSILTPNGYSFILAFIMAILCGIVPILTLYLGIQKIGVGNSAIIGAFEPLFVCFLGVVFLDESLTINMMCGGIIIILSIVFLQIPSKKREISKV